MKQLLFIGLLIIIIQSCATEKRCMEKFAMKPDTVRTVVTKDSLVYRDTTITVIIPGEIRIDSVPIPCPPPPPSYIPDTARAETTYAIAKAWWKYPVIALYLEQKENRLEFRLDSAIKESYHYRTEYEKIKQVLEKKYVPRWVRDLAGFGGLVAGIIILIFGLKVYSFFSGKKIFKGIF